MLGRRRCDRGRSAPLRALASRRSSLIDRTGAARLTAPRGGVLGNSPFSEARYPARRTASRWFARPKASNARSNRCPTARAFVIKHAGNTMSCSSSRRDSQSWTDDSTHSRAQPARPADCGSRGRSAPPASRPICARASVREVGLAHGLVDNKVCAVDDTWSGLRFVYRLSDRPKRSATVTRNSDAPSSYTDIVGSVGARLPPELEAAVLSQGHRRRVLTAVEAHRRVG